MPYVKDFIRSKLEHNINALAEDIIHLHKFEGRDRDGMLNYIITKLLLKCYPNVSYKVHNEIIGMLECCKQEWYRKQVAPYEDQKEIENGKIEK